MSTSQFSVALAVDVDVQTMSIFAKSATIQKVQRPQRKNAKSYKKKETKQKKNNKVTVKEVARKERGGLIMKSPSTIVLHCNDPKLDRVGNSGRAKETQ